MNDLLLQNQFLRQISASWAYLTAFLHKHAGSTPFGGGSPLRRLALTISMLLGVALGVFAQTSAVNLKLEKTISNASPALGDVITYTVAVTNTGSATATSVVVSESMTAGLSTFLSATASTGTFSFTTDTSTGSWAIGSVSPGQTVTLLLSVRVDGEGVAFNSAEVTSMDGTDVNSTPGNGSLVEDDYDNACFSVPLTWYPGDEYTVDKPAGFSAVTWLVNGNPISGTTVEASVDLAGNLLIRAPGIYSFSGLLNGCDVSNCCNILVTPGVTAGLGDFVFEDVNANGVQDAGDGSIPGVTVTLFLNGTAIATTTTDGSGLYSFTGLTPGNSNSYSVGFTAPAGFTATTPLSGTDRTSDSDADLLTGTSQSVTLAAGAFDSTLDAGFFRPASLGDFVFNDTNRDGIQNAGDTPIPGVLVTLFQNGSAVATTTTNGSGLYSFTGLTPGTSISYSVGFTAPAGFSATLPFSGSNTALDSDADPLTGRSQSVTLASGQSNTTIDAGFFQPTAGLGDFVFEDVNANGVQDAGDLPIQGVLVTLYTNSSAIATTTTDLAGGYSFTGLTPGTPYVVGFGQPAGFQPTGANTGSDDAVDSDAGVGGLTGVYSLTANEFNATVDAGFFRPASLGDFVFNDTNQDGIQNAGDTPLSGVVVTLFQNGSAVATTTTGANGLYSFTGLTPGTSLSYSIGFTAPAGFSATLPFSGSNTALDSDINPLTGRSQSVTLASGQNNTTVDGGFFLPTAGLGDFVFEDVNANGVQDVGDLPIPNVLVTLYTNSSVVATTTSDINGAYSFTGLTPGTSYVVGFGQPAGYLPTVVDTGSDALDSDVGGTGLTGAYSLTANEFNATVDAGFFRPASLGAYVFNDTNRDGIQNAGDTPIPGVTVILYRNGLAVSTTTTDVNGIYSFTGLTPGAANAYRVGFSKPAGFESTSANVGDDALDSDADPVTGLTSAVTLTSGESNTTVAAGFFLLTAGLGDFVFEDVNANGVQDAGDLPIQGVLVTLYTNSSAIATTTTDLSGGYSFTGLTPGTPYVVGFGQPAGFQPTGANTGSDDAVDSDAGVGGLTGVYSLTANEFNPTVDAGFFRPATLTTYAFNDTNRDGVQNAGDTPLSGVVVTLFQNGSAVATTTTGADGLYSFTGLTPGTSLSYSVGFGRPAGFASTSANVGDDALDSDADPVTGLTSAFTLSSGQSNTTVAAGFFQPTAGLGDFVFEDVNANGIQDAGDQPISGVLVTLYQNGSAVATTTTDVSGGYSFTGLASGAQNIYQVSFGTPAGFMPTTANTGIDDAVDSDFLMVTGRTGTYTLVAGQFNSTVDAGFFRPASLGDFVFNDTNRDGIQNAGDTPLSGVTVTLFQNGSPVSTVTTGANGLYSFTGLTPGTSVSYSVGFTAPAGFSATLPFSGSNTALDSDADPLTGRSQSVTLSSGQSNTSVDAGFFQPTAGLGDFVFEDVNANGVQDAGDLPIQGVLVTLYTNSSAIATTTTDLAGGYSFTGLTPGTPYVVGFGQPAGFQPTGANTGSDDAVDSDAGVGGLTGVYSLTANEFNATVDAGFFRPASLGDFVFNDTNQDGIQNAGDTPLSGVVVTLFQNGSAVATTTTGANGLYSFTGLTPGTSLSYSIGFTAPAGFSATLPFSGSNTALDSDINPLTGRSQSVTLSSGQSNTSVDAGFFQPAANAGVGAIGDYVWFDYNNDGQQGSPLQEPGVAGLTVQLFAAGNTTVPLATTTTDSMGMYLFGNLPSGQYVVKFAALAGSVFTTKNKTGVSPELDSNVGVVDGLTDVITIDVTQPLSSTARVNLTIDAGIVPYGSIGDYVYRDTNNDGIQNDGNTGIAGITVELYGADNLTTPLAETVTDGTGFYLFNNLISGNYKVKFVLPAGELFSLSAVGADRAVDSDAGPDGFSPVIAINAALPLGNVGRNNLTVDAGLQTKCATPLVLIAGTTTASLCVGNSTSVSAVAAGASRINFYLDATAQVLAFTATSGQLTEVFPTTNLTYYVQAETADGCKSEIRPIVITVNARPNTPSCLKEVTICNNVTFNLATVQLNNVPLPGSTLEWRTGISETSPLVTNLTAVGAGVYYLFERSRFGCYSNPAVLTVNAIDCSCTNVATVSTSLTSGSVCEGDRITLVATIGGSATGVTWMSSNSATAGALTGSNSLTAMYLPSAADIAAGQVAFMVTTNDPDGSGVCTPARSMVVVAINARPAAPVGVVSENNVLCLGSSTRLFGFTTGARINWYANGTLITTTTSGSSLTVTPLVSTTYVAEAVSLAGCTSVSTTSVVVTVNAACLADLAVVKTVMTGGPYKVGDVISYGITVTNNGPVNATAVSVADLLPASLAFVSATPATSYTASTGTWTVGNLLNGAAQSLIIQARILSAGSIVNTAVVTAGNDDPSLLANNTSTVTIPVDLCNTPAPAVVCAVTAICQSTPTESTVLTVLDCAGTVRWSNGMTGSRIEVFPTVTTTYTASCVVGTCVSGPSNPITVVVTNVPAPTILASADNVCVGGVVSLTALGCENGQIFWSDNTLTGSVVSLTVNAETTITAQCRINNCYSPSTQKVIRVGTNLPKPTVVCSATEVCPGGTVTLTAQNCTGTPLWSTGERTTSITVTPTVGNNTYSVLCTDGACTSPRSDDYTIRVTPVAIPTVAASTTSVCAGSVVSLTATGCAGNVTWSNNLTGSVISVTVTSTESFYAYCKVQGCTSDPSQSVTIQVGKPSAPTVRAVPNTAICAGESVTLTVAEGCATGTVKWLPGNLTGRSIVVVPGVNTDYTATCVVDNCESAPSNVVRVIVRTSGTAPTVVASALTVCNGGSVTLTASGCTNGVVNWSNGMTGTSIVVTPTAEANTFSASCRQAGACGSPQSRVITINVNTPPAPTVVCSTSVICPGESLDLTVQNCAGTPVWSTGSADNGKTTITVSPTTTTSYSVVCVNGACTSASSQLYTIGVVPVPVPTVTASSTIISEGESVTLTAANCPGTVSWNTNQTGTSIVVTPASAVSYYTATCRFRSCISDPSATITIRKRGPENCVAKAGTLAPAISEVCASTLTTVTLSATDNGGRVVPAGFQVRYVLTKGAGLVIQQTSAAASFTVAASAADIYTIHTLVYNPATLDLSVVVPGTTTAADVLNRILTNQICADLDVTGARTTVRYVAPPRILGADDSYVCYGETVSVTAVGCENGTVTWSNGQVGNIISFPVIHDTWFSAVCTVNGCTSDRSQMIDFYLAQPKVPTIGSDKLTVCAGDPATLTAQGCENGGYLWSTGATTASIVVTPGESTTYAVKCTIGACQSQWSPVVRLTVGQPATPSITVNNSAANVTTCFGAPVTLTARGCAAGSFVVWSNNQVGSSITVNPAFTASYFAQCCTSNNCKGQASNSIQIAVLQKVPQPVTTNLTNTCPILAVNLASAVGAVQTTGGTLEYYSSSTISPATKLTNTNVTVSGTYYVVEKTTGGCFSLPAPIQVSIIGCGEVLPCDTNPVTADAGLDATLCAAKTYKLAGKATGLNLTTQWTTSGTGTFDNAFSAQALYIPSVTDVQTGQVTLTFSVRTNNTACGTQSDAMVLILNGPKEQPSVAVIGATQLCFGDSVTLQAPAGFAYLWTGPTGNRATTQNIVVKQSGTYSVQVLDQNGCSSVPSVPVVINVAAPVAAPLVANLRNACPATTVSLSTALGGLATAGSTYEYRMGESVSSALVMNPAVAGDGTYYIFERTASQCVSLPARVVVSVFNCTQDNGRSADVAMTKLVNNVSPRVGEALTYTLKVTNNGPGTAYNVDIRDVLPVGLNLVVANSPVSYTVGNGAITKRFDSLAVGASDSIVFMARLTRKGNVVNTASITYGDVVDPVAGNNTASVTVSDNSPFRAGVIGLAKQVVSPPVFSNDSTLAVSYRFTVTNFGDEDLTAVSVTDDLDAVFGAGNVLSAQLVSTEVDSKLTMNPAFTGGGATTQLLAASSTLVAGQTSTFVVNATIHLNRADTVARIYSNTAVATAMNATSLVSDASVAGNDADPDKDGDPTNNSSAATITVLGTPRPQAKQIGVALSVASVVKQADDSYNVTYNVYVKNYSSVALTNVSLLDTIANAFVSPSAYSIVSGVAVNAGSELVVSTDFNGSTAPYYFNSFQSRLAAGRTDTLSYTINVRPNGAGGPFYSQVYATARPEGTTLTVSDKSNAGATIVPDDDTKTGVRFDLPAALLGVAKAVGTPVRVAANLWDVPYTIKVCNLGTAELKQVQVIDDLSKTFGNGAQVMSVTATADAGLTINAGYTGVGMLTSMLDTTASTLPVRAIRYVQLMVRVDVSQATSLSFTNMAFGSAMSGSVAVGDTSNAGSNVDPDNDLDPRNNNDGTRVVLNSLPGAAHIGLAMMVSDTARQANGSYNVTYRVLVKNYGSVDLSNVSLSDSLSNVFNQQVGASFSVLGTPIASAGSRLKVNPGFNGSTDAALVMGDSTSQLAVGATDTLLVRLNVVTNGQTGTFFNAVYGVAKAGPETVSDVSTNGMNPDLNGNNNPTDLSESEATPLNLPLNLQTVFIPEGFSPNGDGINDLFVITGTEGITVSLEIFNRWGHRVYNSTDYKNDWDGKPNTGAQVGNAGNGLPDGTYFYVVKLSDGREYVRYMTINR